MSSARPSVPRMYGPQFGPPTRLPTRVVHYPFSEALQDLWVGTGSTGLKMCSCQAIWPRIKLAVGQKRVVAALARSLLTTTAGRCLFATRDAYKS